MKKTGKRARERRELSKEAESRITVGCCFLTAHMYKRAIERSATPDSVSQGKDLENGLLVRYTFRTATLPPDQRAL